MPFATYPCLLFSLNLGPHYCIVCLSITLLWHYTCLYINDNYVCNRKELVIDFCVLYDNFAFIPPTVILTCWNCSLIAERLSTRRLILLSYQIACVCMFVCMCVCMYVYPAMCAGVDCYPAKCIQIWRPFIRPGAIDLGSCVGPWCKGPSLVPCGG